MFLRRKVAAVARILTDAEAAVDPTVAAQADIPAFCQSPKAPIWYELVKKHVFSKTTSVTKLAIQLNLASPLVLARRLASSARSIWESATGR